MLLRWQRPASRTRSLAWAIGTTALPALAVQPLLLILGCVLAFADSTFDTSIAAASLSDDGVPLQQVAIALSRTTAVVAPACLWAVALFAATVSASGFGCSRPVAFERSISRCCPWLGLNGIAPLERGVVASGEVFVGLAFAVGAAALVAASALWCTLHAAASTSKATSAASIALIGVLAVQTAWLAMELLAHLVLAALAVGAWCSGPPPRLGCIKAALGWRKGGMERIADEVRVHGQGQLEEIPPLPGAQPLAADVLPPNALPRFEPHIAALQQAAAAAAAANAEEEEEEGDGFSVDHVDLSTLGVLERNAGAAVAVAALAIIAAEALASRGPWEGQVEPNDPAFWAPQRTLCVGSARLSMSRAPGRVRGRWALRPPPVPTRAEAEAQLARMFVEVDALAADGVDVVVTLIPERELAMRGLARLPATLRARGIECICGPGVGWRDRWVPSAGFSSLVPLVELSRALAKRLRMGQRVHVHCHGGRGRTATVVVATLVALGVPLGEALLATRRARPRTLHNPMQQLYVWWFAQWIAAQVFEGRGDVLLWDTSSF